MTTVILLMAGSGTRVGASKNKMLLSINGKPLYQYAIDLFKDYTTNIIIVVSENDYEFFNNLHLPYQLVLGGASRQESVLNALCHVTTDRVLIHDGARILTSGRIIEECFKNDSKAYFVAIKPKSTIRFNKDNKYDTLDRGKLLEVQTPQGGDTLVFKEALKRVCDNKITITDDIQALDKETLEDTLVIDGEENNIKITTSFDLKLASLLLNMED